MLLLPEVSKLNSAGQLLIIDEVMGRLGTVSAAEIQRVSECHRALFFISFDADYSALRWATARMLASAITDLKGTWKSKVRFASVDDVREECEIIISALVYAGTSAGPMANYAFLRAASYLEASGLQLVGEDQCELSDVDRAIEVLACATSDLKQRLMGCCSASCSADSVITVREAAIVRALCSSLGFPAARLLPGQPVLPGTSF